MRLSDSHILPHAHRSFLSLSVVLLVVLVGDRPADAQWPQWGGPDRNFRIESTRLADSWPEGGPRVIWKKRLGEGFSSIVYDEGVIYTMYRKRTAPLEYTIALDAKTGEKLWEREHVSPVPESGRRFPGPHSTPLVKGDRLFSVGRNAVLRCLDKADGRVVWAQDLVKEFGVPLFSEWGYAPSPLAYHDLIIVAAGRRRPDVNRGQHRPDAPRGQANPTAQGRTLMAFKADEGQLAWKTQDFGIDHSSPILINVDNREQVVLVSPEAVFSVNPADGELLWSTSLPQQDGYMVTPMWMAGQHLFFSTPNSGSRTLSLFWRNGNVVSEELWQTRKLRMTFTNPVQVGNYIMGSGGQAPNLVVCLDGQTGERVWADRGFGLASFVSAGDKVIILEESGRLSLATVSSNGLQIHSQNKIAEPECYTTPTLVDTTLYVRNRQEIMALDLS